MNPKETIIICEWIAYYRPVLQWFISITELALRVIPEMAMIIDPPCTNLEYQVDDFVS